MGGGVYGEGQAIAFGEVGHAAGKDARAARVSCARRGGRITSLIPENSIVPAKRTNVSIGVQKTDVSLSTHAMRRGGAPFGPMSISR